MSPETLFIKDRATYFLNQTVLNPVNVQKLAPAPEIAQIPAAKQLQEEALTKTIQQIKDFNFTSGETNSLLANMLNGFAREPSGWNQYAIRTSLQILPFLGLKKITSVQIAETYIEAIVAILPSHTETTADVGFKALIEAGMILLPHMSAFSRNKTNTQVIPVLRQELQKRRPYTSNETFEDLAGKIDNLDNSLKIGLIDTVEISPKDTTEIADKFRELGKDLFWKHFSPEQSAALDLLVQEAIRDFGMNAIQIIQMSGMTKTRIGKSIRRLKANGSIPDRHVYDDSLTLQVQELLKKGHLTESQIAHALGPGITRGMVELAERKLIERGRYTKKTNNQPQEQTSLEQDIINLRQQDLSRSEIADQLDISITQVRSLIGRLIREEKIEPQTRRRWLNHPITERVIQTDVRVDQMQSNNPGITRKEIAKRLNLPKHNVQNSLERLKIYTQIEQLIAQKKTALQIAKAMGTDEAKAKFDIARLQKLRALQHNVQNQPPSTG